MNENPAPAELRGIESALDRLGAAERASAPGGLEARVLDRVLSGDEAPARTIPIHRRHPGTRARFVSRLGALAALVAVAAGAWLALRGTRPTAPGPDGSVRLVSLEQSVDDLLAIEALLDEIASVDTTAAQDEADEIDSMIGAPWELIDTLDAAIGEEAI